MHETLSLFDPPELELKTRLAARLRALAATNIFLGVSSWKYEGWIDRIYTRERYSVRGRFSRKRFDQECLVEYADVFPIVSGDFAFYRFPTPAQWHRLFGQVPQPFQFAFKVPEEITVPAFPNHARYGARAGRLNPNFLSGEILTKEFLQLLTPYAGQVSLIIFEFAAATGTAFAAPEDFAHALARLFANLPKNFRYSVEVRDSKLLTSAYYQALNHHGVAHLFNSWTDMPGIDEQMRRSEAFTANFTAARALLKPGRQYEESVRRFSPYQEVREPNLEVRKALRELLVRAKSRAEPIFVFVNNRFEGFAPGTISAIVDEFVD